MRHKALTCLLLALLLPFGGAAGEDEASVPTPAPTEAAEEAETAEESPSPYRTLALGDEGADVLALKQRLKDLKYYRPGAVLGDEYNETCVERVKQYQAYMGLEETGVATAEMQELLFSRDGGTPPSPTEKPPIEAPALTEDSFLASGSEFVYESEEEGRWVYISATLHIVINRYQHTGSTPMIWFETDIRMKGDEQLTRYETVLPKGSAIKTEHPVTLATQSNVVLGFNDDFYAMRLYKKQDAGSIIVNGEARYSKKRKSVSAQLPCYDVLGLFADGTAKAFYSNEYTADELVEMGVVNSFCFGPVVLTGGEIGQQIAQGYYVNREPRTVLGYVEPGHYVVMTVEGRQSTAKGTGLLWVAERMQELGVQEALNLDGGNTVSLVFRGQLLNGTGTYSDDKVTLRKVRSISSMIGVGQNLLPLK
ncbi:MAG: phosphodiester glycosidase family protein [Eubacteriales bacterium]|nr:phosphodiester glycosidase family protein [Eubacteriales bacterium]